MAAARGAEGRRGLWALLFGPADEPMPPGDGIRVHLGGRPRRPEPPALCP